MFALFFLKHNAAYEVRISDWSSDVCSSDLPAMTAPAAFHHPSLSRMQSVSILGGAAIMLSLAMGMRQSLGLFMQPVTHDLGITSADYARSEEVRVGKECGSPCRSRWCTNHYKKK